MGIYASDEATDLTLDAQTVNGKVRFGAAGSKLAAMGYISAEKVKLNPETGAAISLTDKRHHTGQLYPFRRIRQSPVRLRREREQCDHADEQHRRHSHADREQRVC